VRMDFRGTRNGYDQVNEMNDLSPFEAKYGKIADHGTAFDIAGKGVANAESMVEAMKTAVWLSQGKGLTGKGVGRQVM